MRLTSIVLLIGLSAHNVAGQTNTDAKTLVRSVANALGGEAALRSVMSIRREAIIRREMRSIVDRTTGPQPFQLEIVSALLDTKSGDVRRSSESRLSFRSGSFTGRLVHQPDGVVVLDAPFSNTNSEGVIAEVARRFPGASIKAVIATSPMWMHSGGIAAYVRRGIPVYTVDANARILHELLAGSGMTVRPVIRPIMDGLSIGTDPATRIVLYRFHDPAPDRMAGVYFPAQRLLYGSDVFLPRQFAADYYLARVADLDALITRNKLDVQRVFGIHMPPADWLSVRQELPNVS